MTIQPIGPFSSLLYLSSSDLQERNLTPHLLTRSDLLKLAREGLSSLGQTADDSVELESYSDKNGILLFICTVPPTQTAWRFLNSDALLDAIQLEQDLFSGPIYWWHDSLWLIANPDFDPRLSEFAEPVENDPLLCARLAEYALPISL